MAIGRELFADRIWMGEAIRACVTFTAFDRGTKPSTDGVLKSISPDLQQDPRSGAMFYHGTLTFADGKPKLAGLHLSPGMRLRSSFKPAKEPWYRISSSRLPIS
ncbi:MAG: hypothetical protein E5Y30_00535 [Mesorhizobium sp.]|nr:MAG: hypothetical protein E5Y30_00535 [Mesorhizobium sp.]